MGSEHTRGVCREKPARSAGFSRFTPGGRAGAIQTAAPRRQRKDTAMTQPSTISNGPRM